VPAALGVIIVDEAVYALQDLQPGLEKVYFTLQEELLKPTTQIKFSPGDTIDNIIRHPVIPAGRQQIAEVLLTSVKLPPHQRWEVNPAVERRRNLEARSAQIAQNAFQHAFETDDAIKFDAVTKRWAFRKDLLDAMIKTNRLPVQVLDNGLGGSSRSPIWPRSRRTSRQKASAPPSARSAFCNGNIN